MNKILFLSFECGLLIQYNLIDSNIVTFTKNIINVRCLKVDPFLEYVVCSDYLGYFIFYNIKLESFKNVNHCNNNNLINYKLINNVCILENGRLIAIVFNNSVEFYNRHFYKISSLKISEENEKHFLVNICFLLNGEYIFKAQNSGKIFIHNFITCKLYIKYDLYDSISSICFDDEIIFLDKFKKVNFIKIVLEEFSKNLESSLSDEELNNIGESFEKKQISENNNLLEFANKIENEIRLKNLNIIYKYKILNKFIKNY